MPSLFRIIGADFLGLCRVCGPAIAIRWLWQIVRHLKECRREHNLQPADRAMGEGPFRCRHRNGATAMLVGEQVMTGIREMWVRDSYLAGDFLKIPPDAVVLDLGANMGNFTLLALAHSPGVRVAAIEPVPAHFSRLCRSLEINKWTDRAITIQAFVGEITTVQQEDIAKSCGDVAQISETDLLRAGSFERIDFLKCDIEGSEFGLLKPGSQILRITRQLAVEVHDFAGDRGVFIAMLWSEGFEVHIHKADTQCATLYARRHSSKFA